jgi:hypothetical protein
MHEAFLLPLAHAGHWLWVLYLPPVLIVIGSILRTKILERRQAKAELLDPPAEPRGGGPRT